MAESTNAGPVASSSTSLTPHSSATILSTLHTLLLSSSNVSVPGPLDHPFAPSQTYGSWKGKAREHTFHRSGDRGGAGGGGEERRMLEQLRDGMEAARSVLERAGKEEGRTKLSRAMKDVITHQSTVLPILSSTSTHTSGKRAPSFPTPPRPMELLTHISKRLGIETYLEESQFGLLKTTLAIAGKKFVLDVELEADSTTGEAEGEGEGDEMDAETETPAHTPGVPSIAQQSAAAATGSGGNGDGEARGKVRLAKLMVNHITKDGETANSTHIANAIRQSLDTYLRYWNAKDKDLARSSADADAEGEVEVEMEEIVKRLWDDMSDLASLDTLSESSEGDKDWFVELEEQANMVDRLVKSGDLFPCPAAVLPNFKITSDPSARYRIRPAGPDEVIPNPFSEPRGCDWLIEYIPDSLPGLVVRRNWLADDFEGEAGIHNDFHVEQLLCTPPHSPGFPYIAEYAHTGTKGGLDQKWSVVQPGPAGYLVGRVGVGQGEDSLKRVLTALRRQTFLNNLLIRVLDPSKLKPQPGSGMYRQYEDEDEDEDGDEDQDEDVDLDILSQAPIALPITMTINNDTLRASMPLPHSDTLGSTLVLKFSLNDQESQGGLLIQWEVKPFASDEVRQKIEGAVDAGKEAGLDLVAAVQRIERALPSSA